MVFVIASAATVTVQPAEPVAAQQLIGDRVYLGEPMTHFDIELGAYCNNVDAPMFEADGPVRSVGNPEPLAVDFQPGDQAGLACVHTLASLVDDAFQILGLLVGSVTRSGNGLSVTAQAQAESTVAGAVARVLSQVTPTELCNWQFGTGAYGFVTEISSYQSWGCFRDRLAPERQHIGTIVRQAATGTSWFVRDDGYRYWIPTGGDFECLERRGVLVYDLTNDQLDTYPDRTGHRETCQQTLGFDQDALFIDHFAPLRSVAVIDPIQQTFLPGFPEDELRDIGPTLEPIPVTPSPLPPVDPETPPVADIQPSMSPTETVGRVTCWLVQPVGGPVEYQVTWGSVSGATHYQIRGVSSSGATTPWMDAGSVLFVDIPALAVTETYEVRAVNSVGAGPVSDPSNVCPGAQQAVTPPVDEALATCNGLRVTVDLSRGQQPTEGDDVILGTAGDDAINAGAGRDIICGLGGDDIIHGGDGADTILGGDGGDVISGGQGRDIVFAGSDDDFVSGGKGKDTLRGGDGDDDLRGNEGTDTIAGGDGDDLIRGGQKADVLNGGLGQDVLVGGTRPDVLDGGPDLDRYDGGGGADTCVADRAHVEEARSCEAQ